MQDDFGPFEGTVTFDCADCEREITAGMANSCITLCNDCFTDMLAQEAADQSYHKRRAHVPSGDAMSAVR